MIVTRIALEPPPAVVRIELNHREARLLRWLAGAVGGAGDDSAYLLDTKPTFKAGELRRELTDSLFDALSTALNGD